MKPLRILSIANQFAFTLAVILGPILLSSTSARAEDESRAQHKFGIYANLLGDPYVSRWGVNAAYNLSSFMRINVGYGSASVSPISITSIGAGMKFYLPSSFSPVVGLNYTNTTVTLSGTSTGQTVYGISANGNIISSNIGFDWQTHYGLDIGFGYNVPITAGLTGVPYFLLGWFF